MSKRAIQPQDINRFMCPGDPQVSPDGKWLVFTVQRADVEKDCQTTNLWIAPVDAGKRPRPLTTGDSDHSARWSPDGRTIAFVSGRSGRPQIWLIRADGGEPWQLPTEQSVAGPPEWSPDGTLLAFTARVFDRPDDWEPYPGAPPGDRERAAAQARKERAGQSGEGSASGNAVPDDARETEGRVSDVKVVTRLRYRFDGTGYFGDRRSQVFVIDATASGEVPGTARMITGGDYDHLWPCWTAEGELLTVASRRDDADLDIRQDLWLVDPDSGELTMVYRGGGPIAAPRVSPDGTRVAFLGHNSGHGPSTTWGLIVIPFGPEVAPDGLPLGREDGVSLLEKVDRPAGSPVSSDVRYAPQAQPPQWSEDSRYIYHLMGDHGTAYLVRLSVPALGSPDASAVGDAGGSGGGTARPEILAGDPERVVAGVSYSAGVLAYQAGTSVQADEIYLQKPVPAVGSGVRDAERRVSDLNGPLLSEFAPSPAEKFVYSGADGWEIDGWLVRPPGENAGPAPHPAVLLVHGGPHGVYGAAFMFQAQLLASNGFAVVYANPRGSQSYGQEFASACVGDWGGKDYEDIIAGLDHVVSGGAADPERLGITGWSYGGYMTSWAITQTGRFRAAVAGAIIYNRHNFWGTSDIGYTFGRHHCGGTPWDEPELLLSRSAAKYTGRVSTPLLLLHGEGDLRCPIEQTEQFFVGLRFLGKTAVMVRYPGEYHAFRKPSHKADRYARTLGWFRYYLMPREGGEGRR